MENSKITMTDFLFYKAGKNGIPLSGTFELSPVCNFSCKMCYVRKTQADVNNAEKKIMTLDDWIKLAEEARDRGMLYILLTGGEPLLWPDFWELYDRLVAMGFLVSINSNGSMIDEAALEHFRRVPPRRINITLYGSSDETYTRLCRAGNALAKVDWAIKRLKETGISVKLNCSLTPDNCSDLESIVQYADENQLVLQVADYMFPPIRRDETAIGKNRRFTPEEAAYYRLETYRLQHSKEQYRSRLEEIVQGRDISPGLDDSCEDPVDGTIRCRAGKSTFWITWDGMMTPCGMMNRPAYDVREHGFNKCWHEIIETCSGIKLSGRCENCDNRNSCHSCAAMALAETGDFQNVPEYLCEIMKEMRRIAEKDLSIMVKT